MTYANAVHLGACVLGFGWERSAFYGCVYATYLGTGVGGR